MFGGSLVVPSVKEQIDIADFIDAKLLKFSKLMKLADEQILYFQERRTALISAAVTGKIDVRNWLPPEQAGKESLT
ncbi:MAG: hypothetical protein L3J01_05370 [Thiomicrorhabdus sp.]|nr:hypothetical protein [Thiomicrorhabdus sp.]